jgi:hypothetical protein
MIAVAFVFASLVLAGLLVGSMFAVCLIFNPARIDASTYVSRQQWGIRTLHPALPLLGMITALSIIVAAILSRSDGTRASLLLIAAALFIVAGLITRLRNQPINKIVTTWSPQAPPADWSRLRDAWWRGHTLRFGAGLAGLSLLILAALHQPV